MDKAAVGLMEFSSITWGLCVEDEITKNSHVEIVQGEMVCPGKYLLVFAGKHAEVTSAVERIDKRYDATVTARYVIGNLSNGILNSLGRKPKNKEIGAIGIIELKTALKAVYAADEAVKTSHVVLEDMKLASGIGGKGIVILSGGISEVTAAVTKAVLSVDYNEDVIAHAVISGPGEALKKRLMKQDNGGEKRV